MRFPAVALFLLAFSAAEADQITVKNGDRVTGAIVKKDEKTLTIKSEVFGLITLPWEQVQTIVADQPVNVVLSTGETVKGTLKPREQNVAIEGPDVKREVPLAEITTLRDAREQRAYERLLAPRAWELWSGTASLGFAGTQGNAKTRTFTTSFDAARTTSTDKVDVYFKAIRAFATIDGLAANTAEAARGGWGYRHNLSSRLFVNTFNDYEFDKFQNLDLRFVLGGGFGFIAWKGERGRLDLLGGGAYNRESFAATSAQPGFTRKSGEAYFGDDFNYKLNSHTSIYQNSRFFPNLSETGEYRFNFDIGANTQLTKWLDWTVAISDRLLSNPVPGRQTNDLLYTTGIGFTFPK